MTDSDRHTEYRVTGRCVHQELWIGSTKLRNGEQYTVDLGSTAAVVADAMAKALAELGLADVEVQTRRAAGPWSGGAA